MRDAREARTAREGLRRERRLRRRKLRALYRCVGRVSANYLLGCIISAHMKIRCGSFSMSALASGPISFFACPSPNQRIPTCSARSVSRFKASDAYETTHKEKREEEEGEDDVNGEFRHP